MLGKFWGWVITIAGGLLALFFGVQALKRRETRVNQRAITARVDEAEADLDGHTAQTDYMRGVHWVARETARVNAEKAEVELASIHQKRRGREQRIKSLLRRFDRNRS